MLLGQLSRLSMIITCRIRLFGFFEVSRFAQDDPRGDGDGDANNNINKDNNEDDNDDGE